MNLEELFLVQINYIDRTQTGMNLSIKILNKF